VASCNGAGFEASATLRDGSLAGREGAEGQNQGVTGWLGLLPVQEAVEAQGFSSEGRGIHNESDELDSAGHESLDI
jgi:hypothetical protein